MEAMALETVTAIATGQVACVTLNRPQVRNALNRQLRAELREVVTYVNAAPDIRVVVLAGKGQGFCAGADLGEALPEDFSVVRVLTDEYKPILMDIFAAPKPWISAVNGAAAGIGVALAQVCDLSVMADDSCLYLAFEAISLIPDGGATWHLLQGIGRKRTYQIIAERERIPAERCLEWGLCNRVVPAAALQAVAMAWAASLAERAPLTLRHAKAALNVATHADLPTTMDAEAALQHLCISSEDAREGTLAFLQKRTPQWQGR